MKEIEVIETDKKMEINLRNYLGIFYILLKLLH